MKKVRIITAVISVLAGAALCAFLLKDGQLSVWETAAGLTHLALVRVGMMLAGRAKKEAPEERTPSQPAAAKTVALFPRKGSGWKNAA